MRFLFSVLGLLLVVVVVGLLARQSLQRTPVTVSVPGQGGAAATGAAPVTPQQQVEQVRQAVEAQLQQVRPMPDEAK